MEEQQQPLEQNDTEPEIHKPKVIFDGNCEHYWEYTETDPEGIKIYMCKHCPMGKRLRDEFEVKNGKIYQNGKLA